MTTAGDPAGVWVPCPALSSIARSCALRRPSVFSSTESFVRSSASSCRSLSVMAPPDAERRLREASPPGQRARRFGGLSTCRHRRMSRRGGVPERLSIPTTRFSRNHGQLSRRGPTSRVPRPGGGMGATVFTEAAGCVEYGGSSSHPYRRAPQSGHIIETLNGFRGVAAATLPLQNVLKRSSVEFLFPFAPCFGPGAARSIAGEGDLLLFPLSAAVGPATFCGDARRGLPGEVEIHEVPRDIHFDEFDFEQVADLQTLSSSAARWRGFWRRCLRSGRP